MMGSGQRAFVRRLCSSGPCIPSRFLRKPFDATALLEALAIARA